jgi:hypothetical protein
MPSLALQLVPAIGLLACIYLFPESPRWLIDHDRLEEGLENLAKLHANGNKEDPYVQAEYTIILAQIADEHENAAKTYAELFKNKSNVRRILLACACQASTQLTGVSAIQYFSPAIFAQIGISANKTLLYQGINSIIGEFAQFIFFFLIDRVGRRPLQIGGNLTCAVAFIVGAALLAVYPPNNDNNAAHWAFIVSSTWVFNFCFWSVFIPMPTSDHLLTRHQRFWDNVLDHPSRDFQYGDSREGYLSCNNGFLCIQYHDWSGDAGCHRCNRMEVLHSVHRLRYHQRPVLLPFPSRDQGSDIGGNE